MPAIGITGGISTGKTAFCNCVREIIPTAAFFNADQSARELVDQDPDVRKELAAEFGPSIYSTAGDLNRGRLRAIILENAEKKAALKAQALADSGVQAMLEVFPAEIRDVEEM